MTRSRRFKRVFHIPEAATGPVVAIFNEARQDAEGFEPYARQIAAIFAGDRALLEELLAALFMIAHADGVYHPAERRFLRQVAELFGLADRDFHRIEATFTQSVAHDESDPYEILGVSAGLAMPRSRPPTGSWCRRTIPTS